MKHQKRCAQNTVRSVLAALFLSLLLAACGGGGGNGNGNGNDDDNDMMPSSGSGTGGNTGGNTGGDSGGGTGDSGGSDGSGNGGDSTDGGNTGGGSGSSSAGGNNSGSAGGNNPGNGGASVCMGHAGCERMEMQLWGATTKAELVAVDTMFHNDSDEGYRSLTQEQRQALFSLVDDRLTTLNPLAIEADRIRTAILYAINIVGVPDPHPDNMDTAENYGVWLIDGHDPDDPNDDLLTSRSDAPAGKIEAPNLAMEYTGTATYTGDVKGYAYHKDKAGRFTADVTLRANYGDGEDPGEIVGTVSGFSGAGANPAWVAATLNTNPDGTFTVTTDGTSDGYWVAQAYGVRFNDGRGNYFAGGQPEGYVGSMALRYSDGAAVGAFDAKR